MPLIEDTLKSGIKPITLEYEDVRLFDGKSGLVRSFLVINSLELGVLTYREYRFVARRTKQGNHLVKRHIHKLFRAIPRITAERTDINCFTIPVYARLLRDGVLADMIVEAIAIYPEVSPSMLCVELSADLLFEDLDEAMTEINRIRELGVKIAVCEVGDEYCPVFRLSKIPFEYAFIDGYSTASLESDEAEKIAGSLAGYLHYLGVKVIAPDLDTEAKIAKAREAGCDGYTEALFAEYTHEPLPDNLAHKDAEKDGEGAPEADGTVTEAAAEPETESAETAESEITEQKTEESEGTGAEDSAKEDIKEVGEE